VCARKKTKGPKRQNDLKDIKDIKDLKDEKTKSKKIELINEFSKSSNIKVILLCNDHIVIFVV